MKTGVVKEFKGEYSFLSNFYINPFTWRNLTFPSGEHAFQYAKTFCAMHAMAGDWGGDAIMDAPTPGHAKRLGRTLPIDVAEWDKNKVQWMREIVHARFKTSEEDMVGPLINTGAMLLVEGNDWNDTFWGRCGGRGFNTLGTILMEERGYWLRSEFKDV